MLNGGSPDACLAKTEAKFVSAWTRIESRGGCATTNDAADVEAKVDDFVDDLVAALPPSTTSSSTTHDADVHLPNAHGTLLRHQCMWPLPGTLPARHDVRHDADLLRLPGGSDSMRLARRKLLSMGNLPGRHDMRHRSGLDELSARL
jgi:hypothetical protein